MRHVGGKTFGRIPEWLAEKEARGEKSQALMPDPVFFVFSFSANSILN